MSHREGLSHLFTLPISLNGVPGLQMAMASFNALVTDSHSFLASGDTLPAHVASKQDQN